MKEDVEIRPRPPSKRRQLKSAHDAELAAWSYLTDLTPAELRAIQTERARRKRAEPDVIAIIKPREGMTKEQKLAFAEVIGNDIDTHPFVSGTGDYHHLIKRADRVLAFPKESRKQDHAGDASVWTAIKYARHRKLPTRVFLPDGTEYIERGE